MKIPAHKTTIMVHCLATTKAWGMGKPIKAIMKEVTRWHVVDRGWRAVAYAVVLGYGGERALGRDLDGDGDVYEETGAGARGWNKNTIHIALVGGYGGHRDDDFGKHFTPEQDVALRTEIARIEKLAGRSLNLIGHNEVANKACPCFNVRKWYESAPPMPVTPKPTGLLAFLLKLFGGVK